MEAFTPALARVLLSSVGFYLDMQTSTALVKPLSLSMRRILQAASLLVFLAGFQLFFFTEHTDLYFAWTIQPPLTAAFLGAGYYASFLLEFLASREKEWCRGRIAVPAVFIFTTLTLVATILHADRFHFNSPETLARFAAWFWLAIYALVPPAMLVIWLRQWRVQGRDSARTNPLKSSVRAVLGIQSIVLLAMGIGLFGLMAPIVSIWPWKPTPLTSQAVGAWLIGTGVFALHSVWENDFSRVKAGLISYAALGFLQLVALARYPMGVNWAIASTWIYPLLTMSVLVVGLYSLGSSNSQQRR